MTEHRTSRPTDFDGLFRDEDRFHSFARAVSIADPSLPREVEPFGFLTHDLLIALGDELRLRPGQRLVDLGCGRGGPGLWLTRATHSYLVGIDRSPVAVAQAQKRTVSTCCRDRAHFVVGDLRAVGLAACSADAVVSVDALQYAADHTAATTEARRILRPGGRIALTGWHPNISGDPHLPERHRRTDWNDALCRSGFVSVEVRTQSTWTDAWIRTYRAALEISTVENDSALAGLQGEARRRLPSAGRQHRVLVTATAA